MSPIVIRNLAANAAKQRQTDAVQAAEAGLARAIASAITPARASADEVKALLSNEYERCQNLGKPTTNARTTARDRSHLIPADDGEPARKHVGNTDRARLAPQGE